MYIFNNPIIGKQILRSNLKLSDTALYYIVSLNDEEKDLIYLPSDFKMIAEIIDMDEELLQSDKNKEFFDFVHRSKYFKPEKFMGELSDNMESLYIVQQYQKYTLEVGLENIMTYRKANNIIYEKIPLEKLVNIFPFLPSKIEESKYWLNNKLIITEAGKAKLTGKIILDRYPEFNKPYIENVFADIAEAFSSLKDRFLYLEKASTDEIFERFVNKYLNPK